MMLLTCNHVQKTYNTPDRAHTVMVLEDINLSVERGETVAILGPSGSGKSTLLNIIGILDLPTAGTIHIERKDPLTLSEKERARLRNRTIGFVFQFHHLLPQCTVLENILIPTLPRSAPLTKEKARKRAYYLLDRIGLSTHTFYRPGRLSGGESQRVSVARALINKPHLLLADEPTGSLDTKSSQSMTELLLELNREEGTALIVVTHSGDLARRMERLYYLKNGRLEKDGT
jgi:lipoprotein-releasing system ATP-binding protein